MRTSVPPGGTGAGEDPESVAGVPGSRAGLPEQEEPGRPRGVSVCARVVGRGLRWGTALWAGREGRRQGGTPTRGHTPRHTRLPGDSGPHMDAPRSKVIAREQTNSMPCDARHYATAVEARWPSPGAHATARHSQLSSPVCPVPPLQSEPHPPHSPGPQHPGRRPGETCRREEWPAARAPTREGGGSINDQT